MTIQDLLLLPSPRRLRQTGGEVATVALAVREAITPDEVADPGDEAYRLVVDAEGARISARTATGLRWGRATLDQLRRHERVPCLVIDDAPRFPNRGAMLDISRDRVPTMATLFQLVDQLAAWKINRLQLYVEHVVAYEGHEDVWRAASPLTLDELSALDAYCQSRGVALDANQNCLGHFERWLKHPRYAPLGETDRGQLVGGSWYLAPNTLCPGDPRSLALIEELLRQQLPRCSGAYANINCDEPWDLGRGRSQADCDARGRGVVFSEYVARVAAMARALGKRPQFWCDPQPNEGAGLPEDLVALAWCYEDDEGFSARVEAHRQAGREAWVCPGMPGGSFPLGRTWNLRGNLDRAAGETAASGFLTTHWGGRFQWPYVLFGFAEAAMAAWSGPGHYDSRATGLQAFGSAELGTWLADVGDVDAELCQGKRNTWSGGRYDRRALHHTSALNRELQTQLCDPQGEGDGEAWREIAERLELHARTVPQGLPVLLERECRFGLELARWTAARAVLRRGPMAEAPRKLLAARMADLAAEYGHLWLKRNRYGGLEDSARFFTDFASHW